MFSFNPVKDDAWLQLSIIRVLVDSIVLLGLGYYLNNKSNSQNEIEDKNQQDKIILCYL